MRIGHVMALGPVGQIHISVSDIDAGSGDVQVALLDCPTNAVPECSQVKLTATVTGSPCYLYQWCRNGQRLSLIRSAGACDKGHPPQALACFPLSKGE